MKNRFLYLLFSIALLILISCVSLVDRQIPMNESDSIIGEVQTTFTSWQPLYIIRSDNIKMNAYSRLLTQAKIEYGENVDVINIDIKGSFSWHNIWAIGLATGVGLPFSFLRVEGDGGVFSIGLSLPLILGVGNIQEISATGDVVIASALPGDTPRPPVTSQTRPRIPVNETGIEGAIIRASRGLIIDLPVSSRIAVINISSENSELSALAVDELEFNLVSARRFTVVDRLTLDTIRAEQNFQMSGEVSDASALSIGQMLGANIVITGNITRVGGTQRLSIRVLDVNTAQIITMVRETF